MTDLRSQHAPHVENNPSGQVDLGGVLRAVQIGLGRGAGGPFAERQSGQGSGERPAQTLGPLQQVTPGQLLHLGSRRYFSTARQVTLTGDNDAHITDAKSYQVYEPGVAKASRHGDFFSSKISRFGSNKCKNASDSS